MDLNRGFRLGGVTILPDTGRIHGPAGPRQVEPKAMAVLLELARHPLEVRTRAQIEQVVWPRGWISEDALTRCIGQLRRALAEDPGAPRCLRTLPRRGYRLEVAPTALEASAPGEIEGAIEAECVTLPAPTVHVRPLQPMSMRRGRFTAEGITAMLVDRLWLAGRVTIRMAPPACSAARAAWCVEGSVLQAGPCVQALLRLVDARDATLVWSASACARGRDVLPVLNGLADRLAARLLQRLGDPPPTPCSPDGAAAAGCPRWEGAAPGCSARPGCAARAPGALRPKAPTAAGARAR